MIGVGYILSQLDLLLGRYGARYRLIIHLMLLQYTDNRTNGHSLSIRPSLL